MQRHHLHMLAVFVAILATGTAGYMLLEEGWTFLDALYMTFITITTVGYGETHALSPAGRVFTMFLLTAGLGAVALFSAQVARLLIESGIANVFGRKRMRDRLQKIKDHSIICGYGRIGQAIALTLHQSRIPFVVVDSAEEPLAQAEQMGFLAAKGDASSDATLLAAGIRRAQSLVLCIPDDAKNTFIALAARELAPDIHILARGEDPRVEERMIRAGADAVVYPLKLGGEQIARLVARQAGVAQPASVEGGEAGVLGYHLKVFRHFGPEEMTVGQAVARTGAVRAVALRREGEDPLDDPAPDTVLDAAGTLVLLVHDSAQARAAGDLDSFPDWQANLFLGVALMDEEHRELFKHIRRFREAVAQGKGAEATRRILDALLDYASRHFRHEEALMEKSGSPDLARHKELHRQLTSQVMELHRDTRSLSTDSLGAFLDQWLRGHIMDVDRRAAEYLKDQGVR